MDTKPNIGQLQSQHDIPGLIAALGHRDPDVRKRAAIALRIVDVGQAISAVHAALKVETNPQVQNVFRAVLHALDDQTDILSLVERRDVSGLLRLLKSHDPDRVVQAARALGKVGDRSAVGSLVMLFQNPSSLPRVKLAAAEALLELKSAPTIVTLLGALRRESWQVRRNAAAVLGQLQAAWAVEPLAAALNDPEPVVQRTAAAALRRIGTPEAIGVLRAHYSTHSTEMPAVMLPPEPKIPASQQVVTVEPIRVTPRPAEPPRTPEPPPTLPEPPAPPAPEAAPAALESAALPEGAASDDDHPSWITSPVKKLIAFFKRSGDAL